MKKKIFFLKNWKIKEKKKNLVQIEMTGDTIKKKKKLKKVCFFGLYFLKTKARDPSANC